MTLSLTIIGLLAVYNIINVYCDVRWRKTKNLWHLAYFVTFLSLTIWKFSSLTIYSLLMAFMALLYGLLFEATKNMGAGDTKMFITNTLGLSLLIAEQGMGGIRTNFMLFIFFVSGMLILIHFFRFTKRNGLKFTLFSLFTHAKALDNSEMRGIPAAVAIALSVIFTVTLDFT